MDVRTTDISHTFSTVKTFYITLLWTVTATVHDSMNIYPTFIPIHPGIHPPALAKHPVIVDCIWQMRSIKAWWSILQWLHWTDLPTPSKPWLGTGKGSSHSNLRLKPCNHVPIHQFMCQVCQFLCHVKINKTKNNTKILGHKKLTCRLDTMMKLISSHAAEEKNWWMFE